jgi:hypothetical protein
VFSTGTYTVTVGNGGDVNANGGNSSISGPTGFTTLTASGGVVVGMEPQTLRQELQARAKMVALDIMVEVMIMIYMLQEAVVELML